MSNQWKFILLFIFLLVFRTAFGLSGNFFAVDELQTYLIGLKWYCTHAWPYFGPDLIVTETGFQVQIPGALEGLLVGTPLFILPIPEAPYIFLNLLSLIGIAYLAWYISKRLPEIPFLFTFAWIALLPWNLNESTWVLNPSYLLLGSVIFFIGFMEAVPSLATGFFTLPRAFASMGFGLFWDMQFHFSWILLPTFVVFALWSRWHERGFSTLLRSTSYFLAGAIPPAAFLIPTLLKYGWTHLTAGAGMSQPLNYDNIHSFYLILARYLSLACFEIPRFVGLNTVDRLDVLKQAPWLAPPGLFLLLVGWIQPFVMLYIGFLLPLYSLVLSWVKNFYRPEVSKVFDFAWAFLLLIYVVFWFTTNDPLPHLYYFVIPVIIFSFFYIRTRLILSLQWGVLGQIFLTVSFLSLWGFMVYRLVSNEMFIYFISFAKLFVSLSLSFFLPLIILARGWKKDFFHLEAPVVFRMAWGTLILIYISFWFTSKDPLAHIYYITIPVVIVFSFYVWSRLAMSPGWRVFGQVCLAASFLFQWGFMVQMMPKRSLYTNRPLALKAIQEKNYKILGERRPGSLY